VIAVDTVHSWYRIETPAGPLNPEPGDAYGRLAMDARLIIAAAHVPLTDGATTPGSAALIDEGGIWLNGAPPESGDGFAWPSRVGSEPWWTNRAGQRWWDACDTRGCPYDTVVRALLIRTGVHYGASIRVMSSQLWDAPGWAPARRLVVAVFGPDADRSPLEPT